MQKKAHLLTDLKKQVMILKTHLDNIQKHKTNRHDQSNNNINRSSLSQSSRFNTLTYDSTYLDRGVKKFALEQSKFKNLSQLITQKSKVEKQPRQSEYRFAQGRKTRENFSTQKRDALTFQARSPNPLTGEGYNQRRKGIRTKFQTKENTSSEKNHASLSGRKHYPPYLCR